MDQAPRPWRPSGIVSLLSDYGSADPYVGIVKAVLLREAPSLRTIVDLSHAVPPGDVRTAAFLLERSWSSFPAGSVHAAIVDPGVGSERALLLVEARGHAFLAPDNGLLAPLIASEPMVVVRRVGSSAPVRGPSTTFDGRDRFAPLAARMLEGDPPAAFGEALQGADAYVGLDLPEPRRLSDGSIEAEVIHVDRFGNCITSLPFIWLAEAAADWREHWVCQVGKHRAALVRTYDDAASGTPVALADSYERMEIALVRGSAAGTLGIGRGTKVRFVPSAQGAVKASDRAGKKGANSRPLESAKPAKSAKKAKNTKKAKSTKKATKKAARGKPAGKGRQA